MPKEQLKNILLVEDDQDIQEVAKLALSSIGGFTIIICNSGEEAIEKAKKLNPQLVLLDVMMPHMDGPTTLQKLRELPLMSKTPVIFLTAKAQIHEVESYKKLGALEVISKPFDPLTLSEVITKIWDKME